MNSSLHQILRLSPRSNKPVARFPMEGHNRTVRTLGSPEARNHGDLLRARLLGAAAFTLIEMLVVMGIISLLALLVAPAVASILKGNNVTAAGQMVGDQLALARQTALATNTNVELRFYQYADPSVPSEAAGSPRTGKFRAFQSFAVSTAGVASPLSKVLVLPGAVIVDSGAFLSTIIGNASATSGQSPAYHQTQTTNIPQAGSRYYSVAFQFRPDGSTNLSSTQVWFLSVHPLTLGDQLGAAPQNYFTVQIDPVNGNTTYFRP